MDLHVLIKKATEIAQDIVPRESIVADKEGIWVSESMNALKSSGLTGNLLRLWQCIGPCLQQNLK